MTLTQLGLISKQWFSVMATQGNHMGNYRKHFCLGHIPKHSDLIGLGCDLGIKNFKSTLGDSEVQPSLGNTALNLTSFIRYAQNWMQNMECGWI